MRQPAGSVFGGASAASVPGSGRDGRSATASPTGSGSTRMAPPEASASACHFAMTGAAPSLCSNHCPGVMPSPATSQFSRLRVLAVALG